MNYKETTSVDEIEDIFPHDVSVDADIVGNRVARLELTNLATGKSLVISEGRYTNFEVLVPAPPKMVKRFRLHGKYKSLPEVDEVFDDAFDADTRRNTLRDELGLAPDEPRPFEISEVEVEEP